MVLIEVKLFGCKKRGFYWTSSSKDLGIHLSFNQALLRKGLKNGCFVCIYHGA